MGGAIRLGITPALMLVCGTEIAAQQSQDPFSEVMARTIMLRVHQLGGDPKLVAAEADEAIALCKEHGFSHYLSMALVLRGWTKAMTGETDAGISEINTALQQERRGGALLYETYALGLLAEACIKAERYEQSLGFLTRAAQLLNRDHSETFYGAEIYRLLAETRFRLTADLSEAAAWISKGLELAHAQGATSLERKLRQTAHRLHGRTG